MVFQRLLVFFATIIDKIATAILPKSWASELRVLVHLAVHPVIGDTHKARLESFYGAQAADYDAFRKRLLQGREQLVTEALTAAGGGGGVWVDLGGGTGANLDMAGDEVVMSFAKVYVVDLCGPLLKVARERCAARGWHNVECVEADATTWLPDEGRGKVDLVTFSYSLTMIPDWFAAVDHAAALLADDGVVGAVDFYVARKHPAVGWGRHGWLTRTFWPVRTPPPRRCRRAPPNRSRHTPSPSQAWFANDNVFLSSEHLPYLHKTFAPSKVRELASRVPYIGLLLPAVPYYIFVGKLKG